jgi:cysteine desulfurase
MNSKRAIYADNAATTKLDPMALEAMLPFLSENFANPSSQHSAGKTARRTVESAREQIAASIGAKPKEIIFTSSGTESANWAIKCAARALSACGKHLVTSAIEHHAVLNSFRSLRNDGYSITQLPVSKHGLVSVNDFEVSITPETTFASIMFANNEIGTVQDIAALATVAHNKGLLFHTDAVQAVGHIPLDVDDLQVDLLSASAHKFNGPKGIGFLYKRLGTPLASFIDGGGQENGQRAGTENVAGIVGMAVALRNNLQNISRNMQHLQHLADLISCKISEAIPEAVLNGHPAKRLPGLVSISLKNLSGESLLHLLDLKGILVSSGAACNSKKTVISHVLKAVKLQHQYAAGTIRISLSKDNTDNDVVTIAETIIDLYYKQMKNRA